MNRVYSTKFLPDRALADSSEDLPSEFFRRVGRPGDELSGVSDFRHHGLLLVIVHKLEPDEQVNG